MSEVQREDDMTDVSVWEGWHFLPEDGRLWGNGNLSESERAKVEAGVTYRIEGEPVLCARGLHAAKRAIDALAYAPDTEGLVVCRVRLGGTIVEGDNKACASERTVLWMADATRALHEFALWCAEGALKEANVTDERSWEMLEVKRRWLDGQATDDELAAAEHAARAAAGDAAWNAAWNAAWDAVWAAAWAAARAAARAARAAAGAAAWNAGDAARDEQNDELERRLMALRPVVTQ